jgi:hypothetical protein
LVLFEAERKRDMTVTTLMGYLGQRAQLRMDRMTVEVRILDAKVSYGCVRFQVQPVTGTGVQWVDECRVAFAEPVSVTSQVLGWLGGSK